MYNKFFANNPNISHVLKTVFRRALFLETIDHFSKIPGEPRVEDFFYEIAPITI